MSLHSLSAISDSLRRCMGKRLHPYLLQRRIVYLCAVIDVFTGGVLGFNIGRTHDANFVLLAIRRAIERTGRVPQWFHSDQGSEYASSIVRTFLTSPGANVSMNPQLAPWCNGSQESFFARFKVEFREFERFDTCAELLKELYQQLHYFTFERIKTKLKMSPAELRREWIARQSELFTQITSYQQVMSLLRTPSRLYEPEKQPLPLIE